MINSPARYDFTNYLTASNPGPEHLIRLPPVVDMAKVNPASLVSAVKSAVNTVAKDAGNVIKGVTKVTENVVNAVEADVLPPVAANGNVFNSLERGAGALVRGVTNVGENVVNAVEAILPNALFKAPAVPLEVAPPPTKTYKSTEDAINDGKIYLLTKKHTVLRDWCSLKVVLNDQIPNSENLKDMLQKNITDKKSTAPEILLIGATELACLRKYSEEYDLVTKDWTQNPLTNVYSKPELKVFDFLLRSLTNLFELVQFGSVCAELRTDIPDEDLQILKFKRGEKITPTLLADVLENPDLKRLFLLFHYMYAFVNQRGNAKAAEEWLIDQYGKSATIDSKMPTNARLILLNNLKNLNLPVEEILTPKVDIQLTRPQFEMMVRMGNYCAFPVAKQFVKLTEIEKVDRVALNRMLDERLLNLTNAKDKTDVVTALLKDYPNMCYVIAACVKPKLKLSRDQEAAYMETFQNHDSPVKPQNVELGSFSCTKVISWWQKNEAAIQWQ